MVLLAVDDWEIPRVGCECSGFAHRPTCWILENSRIQLATSVEEGIAKNLTWRSGMIGAWDEGMIGDDWDGYNLTSSKMSLLSGRLTCSCQVPDKMKHKTYQR